VDPGGDVVSGELAITAAQAGSLRELTDEFWAWRAATQAVTPDDLPRLVRPSGWAPDWSDDAVRARGGAIDDFRGRLAEVADGSVAAGLLELAIGHAEWELNGLRGWERDPLIAVRESLGALLDLLVQPRELIEDSTDDAVAILAAVPALVADLTPRVGAARAPFARLAIAALDEAPGQLDRSVAALGGLFGADRVRRDLIPLADVAGAALADYRALLERSLPALEEGVAIAEPAYRHLLNDLGGVRLTPDELVVAARAERDRAVALEEIERNRNRRLSPDAPATDIDALLAGMAKAELEVRLFLEEQDLLTVPAGAGRYGFEPMPRWIVPLEDVGNTDWLGSPAEPERPAYRYVRPPSPNGGYFARAAATDPRTTVAHEGMHVLQFALSATNPDPARRRFHDSVPNEGIALYTESLLLGAGLFDDRPHTRALMHNMQRLRAIRAEVDVQLALGRWSIDEAAAELVRAVPLDPATAHHEATFFATSPGQAASYLAGKLELERFLALSRRRAGDAFSLRTFHDELLRNGHVPVALLERELLADEHTRD
jgi:uncharacterized protein DUF885